MSTNFVEIVEIAHVKPHPDADRLDVAIIRGTTVVVPRGEFTKGEKVVYFPPDMLVPKRVADEFGVTNYLKNALYPGDVEPSQCRVAACRLRGQPSFGFIVKLDKAFGTNVSHLFAAVKYQPPQKVRAGDIAPDYPAFHNYTDIEHYWRFPEVFPTDMPVRVTEKLHGTNSRVGLINVDGEWQFMAGSRTTNRKPDGIYWEPLQDERLLKLLTNLCDEKYNVIVFGEIFGPGIQDLDYGVPAGTRGYRIFDIALDGEYMDWSFIKATCFNLPTVPVLYEGPFCPGLIDKYTHGDTLVGNPRSKFRGREGIVITSSREQYYGPSGGRRIAKSVSADYLARKGGLDLGEAA